jgi:hypothetical protein
LLAEVGVRCWKSPTLQDLWAYSDDASEYIANIRSESLPNRRAAVADFLRRNPLTAFVTWRDHEGSIRSMPPSADLRRWLQRELGETKAI